MATVLNIHLNDLSNQFINDLQQKFGNTAAVEIRFSEKSPADDLFSEADFWRVIEKIDWSKKSSEAKIGPAARMLAKMSVASIYLFADRLSAKLYDLDTRAHANQYAINEPDGFVSVDDFLYARCAVIAEGKAFFEKVLNDASEMPSDLVFEPLLYLADDAFESKMGIEFNYKPTHSFETQSNLEGWKKA